MKCPICGQELKPGKKDPNYLLCYNCKKKFKVPQKKIEKSRDEDEEEQTFRLVTSIRGNSMKNLISTESPIGKAILGHKVGDRVSIKVNDNYTYYVVIKQIENTKEDENDSIRGF